MGDCERRGTVRIKFINIRGWRESRVVNEFLFPFKAIMFYHVGERGKDGLAVNIKIHLRKTFPL